MTNDCKNVVIKSLDILEILELKLGQRSLGPLQSLKPFELWPHMEQFQEIYTNFLWASMLFLDSKGSKDTKYGFSPKQIE